MKLFDLANQYCKESTWKTLALLKFCLFSIGIIVGVLLPDACKIPVIIAFSIIFVLTYVPLMLKLYKLWKK